MLFVSRSDLSSPLGPEGQLRLLYQRLALINRMILDLEVYEAQSHSEGDANHPVPRLPSEWLSEAQGR